MRGNVKRGLLLACSTDVSRESAMRLKLFSLLMVAEFQSGFSVLNQSDLAFPLTPAGEGEVIVSACEPVAVGLTPAQGVRAAFSFITVAGDDRD